MLKLPFHTIMLGITLVGIVVSLAIFGQTVYLPIFITWGLVYAIVLVVHNLATRKPTYDPYDEHLKNLAETVEHDPTAVKQRLDS